MPVRYPAPKPGYTDSGELQEKMLNAIVVAPLARLIAPKLGLDPADFDTIEEIEAIIPSWENVLGFDVTDLQSAMSGTYTGDDAALSAIQAIVGTLRGGLTGIIDWSRIPQLSLSQLTDQPGPSLLTGFGDFASEDTMDGGGDWTWDATVGGGSARASGSGARKVLTSELVAVSEGRPMS
ncbi:hypothetical protein ACPXB3_21465, partial [Gordonia sp. DT219]|uniref:hypothetical protein n=1 Tax=Gordonia sp. DT219 TaxID=3416658 RepID=UPI003CEDA6A3